MMKSSSSEISPQVEVEEAELNIKSEQVLSNSNYKISNTTSSSSSTTYLNNTNMYVKPLLNGLLTGQCFALVRHSKSILDARRILGKDPYFNQMLKITHLFKYHKPVLKKDFLIGAAYTTASLGLYEILTKKLRATTNEGRPLSLYQEACCGAVSGAVAGSIYWALSTTSASSSSDSPNGPKNFSYRTLFNNLSHKVRNEGGVLALWKGSGLYIGTQMAINVGLLVSYHRSLNYFIDNSSLSKWGARISAGIVSGFFAIALSHPFMYVKGMKNILDKQYNEGKTDVYKKIPFYISRILTPYSGSKFYRGFIDRYSRSSGAVLVRWIIFENICSLTSSEEERSCDNELQ